MDKSFNNAALVLAYLVCKYCVAEIWLGAPNLFSPIVWRLDNFVKCTIYPAVVNRKEKKKKNMYSFQYLSNLKFVILV